MDWLRRADWLTRERVRGYALLLALVDAAGIDPIVPSSRIIGGCVTIARVRHRPARADSHALRGRLRADPAQGSQR